MIFSSRPTGRDISPSSKGSSAAPPFPYEKTDSVTWENLPDELLMEQVKLGVSPAFSALVERHSRRFYGLAYRYMGRKAEAEDIVQEGFLRVWKNPEHWHNDRSTKFTTWFYRVIVNLCLDELRKKKPSSLPTGWDTPDESPDQDTLKVIEERRKQTMLEEAMRSLPKRQQTALNLCFYEGVSNQEAADIMGIPIKTLQSLVMRGKLNLKEKLKHFI